MPLIALEGLTATAARTRLLDGVDLVLEPGETVALLGRSGSGKSLTARAMLALPPTGVRYDGVIALDGRNLLVESERTLTALRGRVLAMVFQEPATALNPAMRIGAQIAEPLRIHTGEQTQARASAATGWLQRTGLTAAGVGPERYPHELSGGQRQRVALAIALALSPALLVADEPTSALDAVSAALVLDLLLELTRDAGSALVLITHDLAVARRAARVAVMEAGRIVEDGPTSDVLARPRSTAARSIVTTAVPLPARPPASGPIVLEAAGIVVRRGSRITVDDAGFAVRAGERLAIVGGSGSGKTTLLRAVLGLVPREGTVSVGGVPIARPDDPRLRRIAGMVFQDPATSFDPRQTVGQIVTEALHGRPIGRPERLRRAADALAKVGLQTDALTRRPHAFSGGQRQRIAIARALVAEPRVLIADEALSALDAPLRAGIVALLDRLAREDGLALVFVSHDLALVGRLADRIAVMDAGRIVETGTPEKIFAAAEHPATRALVAGAAAGASVGAAASASATET